MAVNYKSITKFFLSLGISTSIDICIEHWSTWEHVKDVLTFPPSTICIHQSYENKELNLNELTIMDPNKVKRLNIGTFVTYNNAFFCLITKFKNLTELSLTSLTLFGSNFTIEKLSEVLNKQTNLQRLSLEGLKEDDLSRLMKSVPVLSNLTYLKVLTSNFNKQDIESLAVCTNLNHLSLQSQAIIQDFHLIKPRLESVLSQLSELKYLELYFPMMNMNSQFIVSIAKNCSKLTALRVCLLSEDEFNEIFEWKDVMVNELRWLIVSFSTDQDEEIFVSQGDLSTEEYRYN